MAPCGPPGSATVKQAWCGLGGQDHLTDFIGWIRLEVIQKNARWRKSGGWWWGACWFTNVTDLFDEIVQQILSAISNNQHGVLARKSTGTNLLNCFQDWQIAIENEKLIDIIYLDFQKAFDSLVHNKIIAKLSSYGLRYELLSWIGEFLTGRMQRVVIDGVLSNPTEALSGVVQGSVLGPLFSFNLLMILLIVWISARSILHHAVFLQTIWKFIAHMTPW